MSSLKVEVVRIEGIQPHPNADRLEIATVKGWQCVVPKGEFLPGGLAVYFPIDSVLPHELEAKLFPPDSKVKLHRSRVKTIKIRGAISQGLLTDGHSIGLMSSTIEIGADLTAFLGVTKYEPPETHAPQHGWQTSKKQTNPHFHKYTDIENFKNFPELFREGEPIWVLEKIHGSNFRAGWVPTYANTWWKRIKHLFGLLPKYEFVYGSHNVQLQDRWNPKTFHHQTTGTNIYAEMVNKYKLRACVPKGFVVYGEVYGDGIQKGYLYDCQPGERKLRVFDVRWGNEWYDQDRVMSFCWLHGLLGVPVDAGLIGFNKSFIARYVTAPSKLGQKIREGIVIKPIEEQTTFMGRKILKWKNDEFLLKAEDDTH